MFLYFDLGNVLLYFDHQIACRQMGEVAGISADRVRQVLFDQSLLIRYEDGRLARQAFYKAFCDATGTRADLDLLETAASNIFRLNVSMLPVVTKLKDAGYRTGILSNTCESHWRYIRAHFRALFPQAFDVLAFSYQLGACKPDQLIYRRAAELAGVPPQEIFYCDDIPQNVESARAAGFDAVHYTDTPSLVAELRNRGVRFNY
jgi:putative hydrolase of the HAD superfamily